NTTAPDANASNKAMSMRFIDYENQGAFDWLITPSFALTSPNTSQLKFDIAYALFSGQPNDALKVYALPGCNPDLSQAILLFDKSGSALSTAPNTFNPFVPTGESQWRKSEVVWLNGLAASTRWQLAFVARNGYGNNLYVDNVVVRDDIINDIAV